MTEFGIVSVHKTKKFKHKFFCGIKISECTNAYIPCLNAAVFMSEKCYKKSDKKRFLRLFEKAEQKLKKIGITKVYKTKELAELCGTKDELNKIPTALISKVCLLAESVCGIDSAVPRLAIKVGPNADLSGLLSELVMHAKHIGVYTNDIYAASYAADFIFEKFGVIIDIYDISDFEPTRSKYVIDTEKGFVRIGDLKIDGIILGLNTGKEKIETDMIFDKDTPVCISNDVAIKILSAIGHIRDIYIESMTCGGREIAQNHNSV